MWKGTPGIDSLLRSLHQSREREEPKEDDASSASDIPDLFANKDNLREITRVRDAVRTLRREARAIDGEMELSERSCEADLRGYCVIICGPIIGGQKRNLTDRDRLCLEQVLGFQIDSDDF